MKFRYTVMLKIASAMATSFVVTAAVGAIGFQSVNKTFADVASVYIDNLLAINDVSEVQLNVSSIRYSISRALLVRSTVEADAALSQIATSKSSMEKAWVRYYPANVTSDAEMAAAQRFIEARDVVDPLLKEELDYLSHAKWDSAQSLMLSKLGAALNTERTAIGEIVKSNQNQAQASFQAAGERHRRTVYTISIGLVAGVLVLAVVSGLLLRAVTLPLSRARELASQISRGRLNNHMVVVGNDELSDTLRSLCSMDAELGRIVQTVRDNAEQVASAAANIAQGNDDLSQRTQEQAAALEQTASSMEQISASVKQNADGASLAKSFASSLSSDAQEGFSVAHAAVEAMGQISVASNNIAEMAVSIDEIAFQINLLSLNAAVEAARAGDQGRGFAVVAAEVRRLAYRSAEAAKHIKVLIAESTECVDRGVNLTGRTGASLDNIRTGAAKVSHIIAEIATASAEQSNGIDQVTSAISTLDEVTQQNAALVEEASAASHNAMELAKELQQQIGFFSIDAGHISSSPAVLPTLENDVVAARRIAPPEAHGLGAGWKEF